MFFRWDQVFIKREYWDKRERGIYKTHGHRYELELIYDLESSEREKWNYELNGMNQLILSRGKGDQVIRKTYQRIDYIP